MCQIITPLTAVQLLSPDLRDALHYAAERSPFYRDRFPELGIVPGEVRTLADFSRLPITRKEEVAADYRRFVCVPEGRIVDRSCTSGTSGRPVPFVLTESDLQRLAVNEQTSLSVAGIGPEDIVQLCTTMDHRFMAGLAYFMGLRRIGASVIRQGVGTLAGQWATINREEPTALIGVPSFLLRLMDYADANGIDYRGSSLRLMVCIGESIRTDGLLPNALGQRIADRWPELRLSSTYASTEMGAAFTECAHGRGGHYNPDLIFPEILDKRGRPVAPGDIGELVVTTLAVEGMPLIRFRTGDLVRWHTDPCPCGRPGYRLGPVLSRTSQMLKVRGTTVYVPTVLNLVNAIPEISGYVIEACSTDVGQDHLRIHFSGPPELAADISARLTESCKSTLRLRPELQLRREREIQRLRFPNGGRKPRLFIDNRAKIN